MKTTAIWEMVRIFFYFFGDNLSITICFNSGGMSLTDKILNNALNGNDVDQNESDMDDNDNMDSVTDDIEVHCVDGESVGGVGDDMEEDYLNEENESVESQREEQGNMGCT